MNVIPYVNTANEKLADVKKNVSTAIALALKELGGVVRFNRHEFYINDDKNSIYYIGYDKDDLIEVNTEECNGILDDYNVLEQIEVLHALESRLGLH